MTIRIKLTGGLGNQMFQFAAGYSIAKRKNVNLIMDLSWLNTRNLHNGFELEKVFNVYSKVKFLKKDLTFKKINFGKYLSKIDFTLKIFNEPHYHYTSEILNISKHTFMKGYWQSELYFKDYSNEIREIFKFQIIENQNNTLIIDEINKTNSISIHIRRGDYLSKENINHFINLKSFYLKAAEDISKKISKPKFFIFSDDTQWVNKNFDLDYPYTIMNTNFGQYSFYDMYLMSLCKINIIANSSFSWWGAWLNNRNTKIVYAPKYWFKNQSISIKDLYPDTWRII